MATKYNLEVKNLSKSYGNICLFQSRPDQSDQEDLMSLAWHRTAPHSRTEMTFDWPYTNGSMPGTDFNTPRTENAAFSEFMSTNEVRDADCAIRNTDNTACNEYRMEEMQVNGNLDDGFKPHPRYWLAFGDFKEGDVIDIRTIQNAVELRPEDIGKTILIREDHSIDIK